MNDIQDQFEIKAHPQYAAEARERVRRSAMQAGFGGLPLDDIEIAVGEAVTNAILYGSPSASSHVVLLCYFQPEDSTFHIEIRDQGHGFDPAHVRQDDDCDALGGRGVRLMRALMDQTLLFYDGDGMIVHLAKSLPA